MNPSLCASSFANARLPGHLSVCGKRLALTVKQANLSENRYENTVWFLEDGSLSPLQTDTEVANFWWRNETHLLLQFYENEQTEECLLYEAPLHKPQKTTLVAHLPCIPQALFPLQDGSILYLAREKQPLLPHGAFEEDKDHYAVLEEFPFWAEGDDLYCGRRTRIFLHKNGHIEALTAPHLEVEDCLLSKNNRYLWFTAKNSSHTPFATAELFCLHLDDNRIEPQPLPSTPFTIHALCELPNKELLLFGTDHKAHGLNQNGAFYRLKQNGTYETIYSGGTHTCWSSLVSDMHAGAPCSLCAVNETAFFISTQQGNAYPMMLNLSCGTISALSTLPGNTTELALVENDVYYIAMRGLSPPELYRLQEKKETRISAWNTSFSAQYSLQSPQAFPLHRANAPTIDGWLLPPLHRPPDTRCAAILMIHGGPKMAYGPILSHDMQMLSALGYAVLYCNPRGSDGYGNTFADIRGHYGHEDCEDILAFLDNVLLQNPWIDNTRLGVCGGSYGGFAVNWLLAHTNRFAAAVSMRGICNWFSMAALSDIGHLFVPDQVTNPWHNPSLALERSPLRYAQNIQTPTLFFHGAQDHRCPPTESLQLYAALKQCGTPSRLCLLLQEGHDFARSSRPRTRLCFLQEMAAWFAQFLQEEPPSDPS